MDINLQQACPVQWTVHQHEQALVKEKKIFELKVSFHEKKLFTCRDRYKSYSIISRGTDVVLDVNFQRVLKKAITATII